MKKITIAAVRRPGLERVVETAWHGVVLEDGQLERVLVRPGAYALVTELLGGLITLTDHSEGNRITVEVTIHQPEATDVSGTP